MSSHRAERRIREYLSHLIPVPLNDLSESDRICTLCYEAFPPLEEGGDYPVRVRSTHANSTCRHVFGRTCIEEHLSSGRGYSRRCPICRESWFGDAEDEADEEPEESAVAAAHRQRSQFRAPGETPEDRRMELIFGLENTSEQERQRFFASVGQTLRAMPSAEADAQAAIGQSVQAIADAEESLRVIRNIQADRASPPAVDMSQGVRRGSAEEEDEEMERRLMQAELRHARQAVDAGLQLAAAVRAKRVSREDNERSLQRMSQQGRGTAPTSRHSGASPRRDDFATLPSAGRMMRTMGFLEQLHRTEEVMTDSSDIAERMGDVERAVDALWRGVDDDRRRRGNIRFVRRDS
ncbi:hypothetical protein J4E93_001037 [Alternaria ventricosa]|uniref:uncharacterized protein n=1 Tax=Alternaria ventricosa TaxID=1187951 RepID=UPI0020C5A70B|nr:uncharacterized protein J4E93_001037 [Alternaria ventricosa]KAI4653275.1 hypothetical protein J4E93_001037 [Alternaria ventricosa]